MEGGKKVAVVVVLLLVIIAAVAFVINRLGGGGVKVPESVANPKVEMIDIETLEIITRTAKEWKSLGAKNKLFKNPKTGKYTMAPVAVCSACNEKVPDPSYMFPTAPTRIKPGQTEEEVNRLIAEAMAKAAEIRRTYKCPKCGAVGTVGEGPLPVPEEGGAPGPGAATPQGGGQ